MYVRNKCIDNDSTSKPTEFVSIHMPHRNSLVWLALSADDKNDVCCGIRFQGY